jgi:hypothetical protein
MSNETTSGDLVARYFERVLGVRRVGSTMAGLLRSAKPASTPNTQPNNHANKQLNRSVCLLIEVGEGSDLPSIREMGSRMVEAVRNEWLKQSLDHLPEIEWLRADEASWNDAILERTSHVALAIVCGAHQSPKIDSRILHVSSFAEMQDSHMLKREAWRAIQQRISSAASQQ